MPKPKIETETDAVDAAVRYRNLGEVLHETNRTREPLRKALRKWLDRHPGERIEPEGLPALAIESRRSGMDVDVKAIAVQDHELLARLADLGLLRVDWSATVKAIDAGLVMWPVDPHDRRRKLYVLERYRDEMRWSDEEDA